MRVTFILYDDEESADFFSEQFNIYCSNELLKLLNLQNDESAIIKHTSTEGELRYVYCCFKNYSELKIKKTRDCYNVYTVTLVLKSLGVDVDDAYVCITEINNNATNKRTSISLDIEIVKGEKFVPIKEMELYTIRTFYDYNKELLNEYYTEVTNDMSNNLWDNLKNKNMNSYVNLSLLNVCVFEHNVIKLNVLGVGMYLLVKRVLTRSKDEKEKKLSQNICVPYVAHNTKIIMKDGTDENDASTEQMETESEKKISQKCQIKEKIGLKKIGGYKKIKEEIYYYILLPLIYKNVYDQFHIDINRGILLHGPPGCGKTFVALAIKEELAIIQKRINRLKAKRAFLFAKQEQEQEQKQKHGIENKEKDKENNEDIKKEELEIRIPEMEIIKSTDLIDKNNTGEKINALFFRCCKRYKEEGKCSIIFIDEIEILCEKRENVNMNLYATTLLNNMDGVKKNSHTILIGATNFINKIDLALRRSGRFDREIEISIPNLKDRVDILKKKLNNITHNLTPKKVKHIADLCQSFTCSDITALINIGMHISLKERNVIAIKLFKKKKREKDKKKEEIREKEGIDKEEIREKEGVKKERIKEESIKKGNKKIEEETNKKIEVEVKIDGEKEEKEEKKENKKGVEQLLECSSIILTHRHLMKALQIVKPSGMKELYVDIPQTRIKDIGGYKFVKRCIKECLIYPKKFKKIYKQYNIQSPKGILLYGPPGCSKTLFAKAIASEINMNFISVKGPEIFSKYVGESEKAIRYIFKKARENNPCVIFFDEIDSIAMNRNVNQNFVSNRVLCQLLNEIDGIYSRLEVIILAATNRPDLIDPALLRPGRFDRIIYVPLPDYASRVSIFKKTLKVYKINNMLSKGEENNIEKNKEKEEEVKKKKKMKNQLKNQLKSNNDKHYFELTQNGTSTYTEEIEIFESEKCQKYNFADVSDNSVQKKDVVEIKEKDDSKKCNNNKKEDSDFTKLCRFLAARTKKYSGAEIVNLCREASICALKETLKLMKKEKKEGKKKEEEKKKENVVNNKNIFNDTLSNNGAITLSKRHFLKVLNRTKPQTPDSLIQFYKQYSELK